MLKAVSSPIRLQILNLLFDSGALSYTELVNKLKMNPNRDAGRFAYHLKFLLNTDLIEADVEAKKYCLTDLGKMVLDIADRVEKKAFTPKSMMVRESRFALEEFDVNKIANSLIKEAKMQPELAQKVAKEAEKRLLKSKTKYLTSPLVREIVNAILVEKGFEDYRHKYTRLGLPVHEVTMLLEGSEKEKTRSAATVSEKAGETILKEYTLLKALPRDISDAHLSGALHICDLDSWTLKPSEVIHDMRFFFEDGNLQKLSNRFKFFNSPPQSFESALSLVLNSLLHSGHETTGTQTLDYFNVFLAPFVKGTEPARLKESLISFILSVDQHVRATLCLELVIPDFIVGKPAIGASGGVVGKYGDFLGDCQLLASIILDVLIELSAVKPLLSPTVIVKVRPNAKTEQRARALLLKAHHLASERGIVYFANLDNGTKMSSFGGSGFRISADLTGDWELDTIRSGVLGVVAVNLPRIMYEIQGDEAKFAEILDERLEMVSRAFDIKQAAVKKHGEKLLPFLMQKSNGDQYFRLANSLRLVNLIGLREMLEAFPKKAAEKNPKAAKPAENILRCITERFSRDGKKGRRRLSAVVLSDDEASERLAQLDVDRYGLGRVKYSGSRERPFYSTIRAHPFDGNTMLIDMLSVEKDLRSLAAGGTLSVIDLGVDSRTPDELLSVSLEVAEKGLSEFFTYDRRLTYCKNCGKSWFGELAKCPSCGSVGTLVNYDRFPLAHVKR